LAAFEAEKYHKKQAKIAEKNEREKLNGIP
jgi:hypothetical protein